ncbi:MAG: NTP transferase domain-containing protein [Lachnospiraceae bacterium]|nr:NTP transferase domain-containing protein [Lachnospiraceae bacterium]
MNKQEKDILKILWEEPFINQRILAEASGYSLGMVNRSVRNLAESGYLNEDMGLTELAKRECQKNMPRNAVILAAGFGTRMLPVNPGTPKGLLEVNGEPLVERLIRQLHEVDITEISLVVGFMKEKFEYLIDEYGVELVVNVDYAAKNNLYSLRLAAEQLSNTYIVPCDIWCNRNPFNRHEMYSWYMVSDIVEDESDVRVNRKGELVKVSKASAGNAMIGIAYLLEEDARIVRERIERLCGDSENDDAFWESALYEDGRMIVPARVVHASHVVEIDTYEQLRELDGESNHLKSDALDVIAEIFDSKPDEIEDIRVLKKGMTNRSFLFSCCGGKYIMRIPGEGTDRLIDRGREADVYRAIAGKGLCDNVVYINPKNGFKITKFLEGVRGADPDDVSDLRRCMKKLRDFHEMELAVDHEFDIFGQIEFYESLWEGQSSVYRDYRTTKKNVLSLRAYIEAHRTAPTLTHIDAVPDNFLFYRDGDEECLQLTDWEYAGMQDPHVDIAMFCIYSMYEKDQVDRLIDIYFEGNCPDAVRKKIYCYVAACGLLWSNWCEYKRKLGVEFGEYALKQYRFAKEYYKYAKEIGGK